MIIKEKNKNERNERMYTTDEINEYFNIMKNLQLKLKEEKLQTNVFMKTKKLLLLISVVKSNYAMIVV